MEKLILFVALLVVCLKSLFISAEKEGAAMDQIMKVNEKFQGHFIEGDIPIIQRGTIDPKYGTLWPRNAIPYTISNSFSNGDRQKIRYAVAAISRAAPCIRFQEYTSNPPRDHISVFRKNGCWSFVGKTGGRQQLSLGRGCLGSGTIVHEFLHALGFYHEQSRQDRDKYVRIIFKNVQRGQKHNFKKQRRINSQNTPYDLRSVMHYSKYAFSRNGQPTIEWKSNSRLRLGGNALSYYDKLQLKNLYCRRSSSIDTQQQNLSTCRDTLNYCGTIRSTTRCDSWMNKYCPRACRRC